MASTSLPDEVEAVLAAIIQDPDELDAADFNVIEYMNRAYPDEASLSRLQVESDGMCEPA